MKNLATEERKKKREGGFLTLNNRQFKNQTPNEIKEFLSVCSMQLQSTALLVLNTQHAHCHTLQCQEIMWKLT